MNVYTLWLNNTFTVSTPKNPHIPYNQGLHIIVAPKREVASAWEDINLAAATFKLAANICKIMEELKLAPWFNIQANGNWGLLAGSKPFFHIHVYGRNKGESWGKPVILPVAPNTYRNDPMPETDRAQLIDALKILNPA